MGDRPRKAYFRHSARAFGYLEEGMQAVEGGSEPVGLRKINPAAFSRRDGVGSVPLNNLAGGNEGDWSPPTSATQFGMCL